MAKKIGIIGSGAVAQVLGKGFLKHGYEVMLGSRDPGKLEGWKKEATGGKTGTFAEAAKFGDIVVLAVKGAGAEESVSMVGIESLRGKTVIDTTNPIDEKRAPVNGVLLYFTGKDESLMERLQKKAPEARWVKAFNSVGSAFMVNPDFGGQKPTMFICGNEEAAKTEVKEILDRFGWDTADMGKMEAARPIEQLCVLWCIPGFLSNHWSHAFKLLKA